MTTERLLRKASQTLGAAAGTGFLAAALVTNPTRALAQYAVSDSQLQTSVIAALHNDSKLSGAHVNATAAQGVITLTGTATDQDELVEAEQVAAGVSGVRSIQDNISVAGGAGAASTPATAAQSGPNPGQDQAQNQNQTQGYSNPSDQPQPNSAPMPPQESVAQNQPQNNNGMPPPPPAEPGTAASGMPPAPPSDQSAQQNYTPYPNGDAPNGYPNQSGGYPGQYGGENGGYGPRGNAGPPPRPLLAVSPQQQNSSGPVAIAPGTLLSVRTMQPLSTANLKNGDYFQVTAASDLYVNGIVAIPRGAVLSGQVVESKNAGTFGGSPKLDLRLTSMQLGPNTYPLVSDVWSSAGPSKTGYTATNAAGGAIFGALVGAIAGGGVGAGIGAVAGGATGAAVSGATRGPRLTLPPEALLQFHITQPLTVQPLRYNDAVRIAASAPQQPVLQQRPAYPPPYPYPYAIRPYPY